MSTEHIVDCVPRPAVEVHIDAAPRPAIDVNVNIGGGGAGPTKEIDPTVPSWAKSPNKPTYTAEEVGALSRDTKIPERVSDLVNDKGYITGYTETDPTVPAWAKAASKPVYTAKEVGALPDTTVIPTKVSELMNDAGYMTGYEENDPTVPSWAKAATKPSYSKSEIGLGNVDNVRQYSSDNPPPYPVTKVNGQTGDVQLDAEDVGARASTWMPTHSDVGADKSGTAASAVGAHNTKTDAHNDIRLLITTLTTRLDALANSDDDTLDQMAEVVAYIKSNRNLIEQITTGKVSVSDIVNNLTTNVVNKPLSAAQGVALKALIDAITIPTKLSQLTNDKGYITEYKETDPTVPAWAKSPNKPSYTAAEIGALSADKLPEAINEALADAKTSGEFDGQPGKDGTSVTVKSVSESTADGGSNVVTFTDGKTLTVKNGSKGSTGKTAYQYAQDGGYTGTESEFAVKLAAPAFDPTAYNLPVLYLTGDTTGISKDDAVTLNYAYGENSGTCTLKWQGSSSLAYDKKNYTIKVDTAFEAVEGWGAQKKYCLKANFIDHSHARNIVSCKLWGQIAKSRAGVDSRLTALPNAGAVDGFPCVIMLNGEFHGLYTCNIPKDGWMFGMSDGVGQQAIVCGDKYTDATYFKALAALDGSDYEIEYCSTSDTAWVKTSFNRMLQAVIDSNGGNIDTELVKYIDIDSAIDYLIDTVVIQAPDCLAKNTLLVTYDGTKWFFSAYDRDSTFGLHFGGKSFYALDAEPSFSSWKYHRLMNLLWTYKRDAIRARYAELRAGALSEANVAKEFWNFECAISEALLHEDVLRWPTIPSSSVSDVHQILHHYRLRCAITDEWVKSTSGELEPPSGPTNLVPTSIDENGNVFNGKGYMDGYRMNSSGAAVTQSGSTVTGFMPCTNADTIRATGLPFGTAALCSVYGYVSCFDANKAKLASVSMDTLDANKTASGITMVNSDGTYNKDSVTTLTFGGVSGAMAYIRISSSIDAKAGVQTGADLIVTINEEIA